MSGNKAAAIADLTLKTTDGTVPLDRLDELSDAEIVQRLSTVRGIGRWTLAAILTALLLPQKKNCRRQWWRHDRASGGR